MSTGGDERMLHFLATVKCLENCAHLSLLDPEFVMERLGAELDLACRTHKLTWLRDVILMQAAANHLAQCRAAKRKADKVIRRAKCS